MILNDYVLVKALVKGEETDPYGNPIETEITKQIPATVSPLDTSEVVDANRHSITSRYRVISKADEFLEGRSKVKWHGVEYEVEGDIERHTVRGRMHHMEFLIRRVTG